MRRFSDLLAILVALFVGVVPLRDCRADDDGARGVVVLGDHAHQGHDPAAGLDGHHSGDGCTETGHDAHGCCLDAPFDTSFRGVAVSADRSQSDVASTPVSSAPATAVAAYASAGEPFSGAPPAPPDLPSARSLGLASTVLLR